MKKDRLMMDQFIDLQLALMDLCLYGPLHLLHVCAFPLQGSLIQLSPLVQKATSVSPTSTVLWCPLLRSSASFRRVCSMWRLKSALMRWVKVQILIGLDQFETWVEMVYKIHGSLCFFNSHIFVCFFLVVLISIL